MGSGRQLQLFHVTFANEIIYWHTSQQPDVFNAEYTLTKCELVNTCIEHMADTCAARSMLAAHCSPRFTSTAGKLPVTAQQRKKGIDWFILFRRIRGRILWTWTGLMWNRCFHFGTRSADDHSIGSLTFYFIQWMDKVCARCRMTLD